MDVNRVEEILNSPKNITVTYNDEPIWIKSVNNVTQIADIHAVGNQEDERQIPVSELQEK